MKKIVHFSKPFGNLYNLKKDFYLNNNLNLKNSIRVNKKYLKQKKREICKICNCKIKGYDFVSHEIKYKLCPKCNHFLTQNLNSKILWSVRFSKLRSSPTLLWERPKEIF